MWIGTLLVFSTLSAGAQCSMSCGAHKNVSVDPTGCEAEITTDMFGAQAAACTGLYVIVRDKHGEPVPNNTVTYEHIGQTLDVELHSSDNMCWGRITVEDKAKPIINCPTEPIVIECGDVEDYAPTFTDNCGVENTVMTNTLLSTVTNNCNMGLDSNILRVITKRFIAKDEFGNESDPCVVTLHVTTTTKPLDTLKNYEYLAGTAISCDANYNVDANNHPNPLPAGSKFGTGVPSIGGRALFPNSFDACGLMATYSDINLGTNNCVTKIMRTWTIMSWNCELSGVLTTIPQIIEIADTKAPTFKLVDNMTASTQGHKCEGLVTLPMPTDVADNCGDIAKIIVSNLDNDPVVTNLTANSKIELPQGENKLYYDVYDSCGNFHRDSIIVSIEDNTPPVPVCIENTVVSLTSDGQAWMRAKYFDRGSYDECSLKTMVVRRMDATTCGDCEIPEFDHLTYKGTYKGKYYYIANHKFLYNRSLKHATALTGKIAAYATAPADVKTWLDKNVRDSNKDGEVNGDDEQYQTLNTPVYAAASSVEIPAKYIFELTDICGFSKHVKFCCNDLVAPNNPAVVVLRVIDHAGNWNECMVNTTVQDKIGPSITCPPNMEVNCDTPYDLNNLSATFGSPTVNDNCNVVTPTETYKVELDACRIGYITRTFTVANPDGSSPVSCTQRIDFVAKKPFNGAISWPKDTTVVNCGDPSSPAFHPDVLGTPSYTDGACDLVGHRYTDEIYTFNNPVGEACFKILRRWEVIDWCNKYEGEYARWTRIQTIKVADKDAPVITSSCERVSTCTYDATCKTGRIELGATATDACTSELSWSYRIDANNDGSFDAGLSKSGKGNSIDATGNYPVGSHRIEYTFEDRCGNLTTCEQLFDVVNCKAPTPYCHPIAIALMPVQDASGNVTGGMVETWAKDLDNGSVHPCGYDVIFSFEPVTRGADGKLVIVNGKTFTCADLGENTVKMYTAVVTPMGDIIQDYCETKVDIQDNQVDGEGDSICSGNFGRATISGRVETEAGKTVASAAVSLVGSELTDAMTSEAGAYAFPEMATGGKYAVVPKKDDKAHNGVNTRDLIAVQRHLLGLQKITSPYQLIAADANNDGAVTPADLFLMKKVILRLSDKFDNNKEWRFVDKGYTFSNPTKPLSEAFPELYEIDKFTNDMAIDFVAIKVGDVNNSAKAAGLTTDNVETRSTVTMTTVDAAYMTGDMVEVPVSVNTESVAGFQFTIDYDASQVRLVNITSDAIALESDDLAILSEGVATLSWNADRDVEVKEGTALFNLVFEAINDGSIATAVSFNSDQTEAELYTINDTYNVNLEIERRSASESAFALHQNTPNPFKGSTQVAIDMPKASKGTFTVVDVAGKTVMAINKEFTAGKNTIRVSNTDLGAKGVYYYTVKAGEFVATKKMVVIK